MNDAQTKKVLESIEIAIAVKKRMTLLHADFQFALLCGMDMQ